ncbi:hypothetical protein EON83_02380 [bacterium]|nr:MAG: hypothetical protein EON83_02380 [bacterium]
MPLFTIENNKKNLQLVPPSSFSQHGILERSHIQTMLRDDASALQAITGESLLVISEEYNQWENKDSNRRIDLLAIDADANLVIIELKRVEGGEHMELQALRYAAMISSMDLEGIVATYRGYLETHPTLDTPPESAESKILQFLDKPSSIGVSISSTPRIILVSPSFSKEITTTVLWLNERGLDIQCIEIKPYQVGEKLLLNSDKILPLESSDGYIIRPGQQSGEVVTPKSKRTQSAPSAVPYLVRHEVLKVGTSVHLVRDVRPQLIVPDSQKRARYNGGIKFLWEEDGQNYSLSALCAEICRRNNGNMGSGSWAGPNYWAIEGESQTLGEKMYEMLAETGAE